MTLKPRIESKYVLDKTTYFCVRNWIAAYCRPDGFSCLAPAGRYLVRSLYFDSVDYRAYYEKVTGVLERNKLRIRSYFPDRERAAFLNAEEKRRYGSKIVKPTARISLQQYDRFMAQGTWGDTDDPVLQRFEALVRWQRLAPVTVVDYQREAYFSRDGSKVRLSFDHDLRYARSRDLFCPVSRFRSDLSAMVVFEIKTERDDVPWLTDLVRAYDLKAVPNSKYVSAINHTAQAVWY